MYDFTVPDTIQDAINTCLNAIGEPKVNTADPDLMPLDALNALDMLNHTSKTVQLKGWHWNTEVQVLSPDTDGFINLPVNTAKVDTVGPSCNIDVVQRGQKLYNRTGNTYVFTAPLTLELVLILSFEDLPMSCREFITARTAMLFQGSILGAPEIDQWLTRRQQEAWIELMRDEINVSDSNVLRDSRSTASILYRAGRYIGRR